MKVLITDTGDAAHREACRTALIDAAQGVINESDVTLIHGTPASQAAYARELGVELIISSISGATLYQTLAAELYPEILLVMPAGSNTHTQTFVTNGVLPSMILCGAGDTVNETSYDIEFFHPDTITISPDLASYATASIAGQLAYIKMRRACNWEEAREAAQATASLSTWSSENGFGLINTEKAVNWTGIIRRQVIINKLETRLKTILTTNGYHTNAGQHVFVWKSTSYKPEQLPAIDIEDPTEMIDDDAEDETLEVHTLDVNVYAVYKFGATAAILRQAMEDIRAAINTDISFDGTIRRIWQTGSEMGVEQNAEKIIGARLDFQIEYVTLKLSEQ